MKGVPIGTLSDLFAATEAVSNDQPVVRGLTDCWQQFEFANGLGNFVLVMFKAERACHPAAPGRGRMEINADPLQDGLFRRHVHDRLVMAVPMQQCLAFESGWRP